jgi:DNA-binding LacI/PurR family transcriptional regulator
MPTTLKDVALKSGVSLMTVSRVVNGKNNVSEDTRQQVLRVIDELGYVPHLQAQGLASGKTRTIVLHYPLSNPRLFSNVIEMNFIIGIAQGAADEGYYFSLMTGALTPPDLLKLCRSVHADGLILMKVALQDWRVELLREHDYPFVMIGRTENNEGLAFIDLDFENAILEAYSHLVGLGHHQIGFLTFSEEWRSQGIGPAVRSMQGFNKVVKRFKLAPLYRECDLNVKRASYAAKSLLAEHSQLTAIVTMHNTLAVGAIMALQELGRKVPEDCSIVGLPASDESELIIPPLTGIEWSMQDIGYQAAKMLVRELNGECSKPEQILIAPKLVVRSSTAPAPR